MGKSKEQEVVSARVPATVKKTLEALAERKQVNLSEYLRWLLIEHADRSQRKEK